MNPYKEQSVPLFIHKQTNLASILPSYIISVLTAKSFLNYSIQDLYIIIHYPFIFFFEGH